MRTEASLAARAASQCPGVLRLLKIDHFLALHLQNGEEIIQEEEAIDFSIVNEGSVTSTEEVG